MPGGLVSTIVILALFVVLLPLLLVSVFLRFVRSPRSLTTMAVLVVGRKRYKVREEWQSHLRGWSGRGLRECDQRRAARGFLLAAMRYRLEDAAGLILDQVAGVIPVRIDAVGRAGRE